MSSRQYREYLFLNCELLEERQMLSAVDIFAAGTTNQEIIELQIDGQVVQTWTNIGGDAYGGQTERLTWEDPTRTIDPSQIRIAFTNDFNDPATGLDRNVRIDRIVVDGQTIETESANVFSTGTWKPEDGVTPGFRQDEFLHSNGYFQFGSTNSGSTIEARVRGDEGTEQFNLIVDGNVVRTFSAQTNFQNFSYTHAQTVNPGDVRIEFLNDQFDPANGIDSNLIVDFIEIDGTTYQTNDASVFSTGTWNSNDGVSPGFGRGETLHANGYFQFGNTNNGSVVEVVARGSEGGEQFNLVIDGQTVATHTVTTANQGFVYQANGSVTPSDIRVEFINDAFDEATSFDRNLTVDFVKIDGTDFQTKFPRVFSVGSWTPEDGVGQGYNRGTTLHSNGYFQFAALERNARFRVTFDATWDSSTHPGAFPTGAHFSGLIGATHSPRVQFWAPGEQASQGIEDVAELGAKTNFSSEINNAISAGAAENELSGGGITLSPDSVSLEFDASANHSFLTLISMIAPSPDWFVGVHDFSMIDNDGWIDDTTVQLFAYDSGTDDGVSFNSPDIDNTNGSISLITDGPLGGTPSLGTFRFQRIG